MFKPTTLSVAKSLVDTLHFRRVLLTNRNAEYPACRVANMLATGGTPTYAELEAEDRTALTQAFKEANERQSPIAEEEYDELVGLMAQGVERMLVTARTVIVPFINDVTDKLQSFINESRIPQIAVDVYNYAPIHSEAGLMDHILADYDGIKQLESYRTFRMEQPDRATLEQWVCSNQHAPADVIKRWFATLSDDDVKSVWRDLFHDERRLFSDNSYSFSRRYQPQNLDKLLFAYFLTIYLHHEPQDPLGESVSLDEWKEAFHYLHRYLGALLNAAYTQRAKDVRNQRLILRSSVVDGVATEGEKQVWVLVNGDLWESWLDEGNDIKVVLGAAVAAPALVHAADLAPRAAELIEAWNRKHYLFKQRAAERFDHNRRFHIRNFVSGEYVERPEGLPKLSIAECNARLDAQLALYSERDLDDLHRVIKDLVCDVYYPNTPYRTYLDTMQRVASEHGLTPREAALLATTELVAVWLADQFVAQDIELDIREQSQSTPVETSDPAEAIPAVSESVPVEEEVSDAPTVQPAA